MQQPNWIFAFASVIGNSHISENIPCQDFCNVEDYENFSIAIVCDGAGTCKNSHIGSKQVAEFSLYHFEKLIKSEKWDNEIELPTQDIWHSAAKNTLFLIKEDLFRFSLSNDIDFKSMSCTVIVTIALQRGLLVTHIGDGRAGYCNMNDEWLPSIIPFHGELANQTVFITSDIWSDEIIDTYVESNVIDEEVKAFCLLSDGCERATFECNLLNEETKSYFDPNKPYAPFFDPNIKNLYQLYKENKTQVEINELWGNFLTKGNEKLLLEPDDKSLIFGVRYFEESQSDKV